MRLTNESFQAITWHRYLGGQKPVLDAITRDGRLVHPKHISIDDLGALEFHRVTGWWAQFDAWQGWLDGLKRDPRPKVWRRVPLFAWRLRRAMLKARKPVNDKPDPPPVPQIPPLPPRARAYVNLIFAAQNPLAALSAMPKYRVLFTADPGYDDWSSAGAAEQLRGAGHEIGVWYVPTQVSRERAQEVAARLGTTFIMGQAETIDEFWTSVNHERDAVIGNLSACFQDPKAMELVDSGKMIFVNEFYWNQDRSRKPDNHNHPVPSLCKAYYDGCSDSSSGNCFDPDHTDYERAGYVWPTESAYGPGMTTEDYRALP